MSASTESHTSRPNLPPISTDFSQLIERSHSTIPKVWFLTDGLSPIAVALSRTLLRRGDYVVSSILPEEFKGVRGDGLRDLLEGINDEKELREPEEQLYDDDSSPSPIQHGWKDRFKVVPMDARRIGQTQSAIAETVDSFGHIDVLLVCRSEGTCHLFAVKLITYIVH
jgi:NAD(P)-dependent dehydrogenase (short-subunit alcohol dehydrogenase family)